jgi:hypothetical protein
VLRAISRPGRISGDRQTIRQFLAVRMGMLEDFLSGCLDSHRIREREPVEERPYGLEERRREGVFVLGREGGDKSDVHQNSQSADNHKSAIRVPSRPSRHGYDIAVTLRE